MRQIISALILWTLAMLLFTADTRAQSDAVVQCEKALQLVQMHQTAAGLALLESGFASWTETSLPDHHDLAECTLALGQLLEQAGYLAEAKKAYQAAVDNYRADGDRPNEDTALNDLGLVYEALGEYDKA